MPSQTTLSHLWRVLLDDNLNEVKLKLKCSQIMCKSRYRDASNSYDNELILLIAFSLCVCIILLVLFLLSLLSIEANYRESFASFSQH